MTRRPNHGRSPLEQIQHLVASYTSDGRVLRLVLTGQPDWADTRRALEAALGEAAFQPGTTRLLIDARSLDSAPTVHRLRRIAHHLGRQAHLLGGVAVVVGDPLRYGLARMLATFAESHGVRIDVFDAMPEAERWADQAGRPG